MALEKIQKANDIKELTEEERISRRNAFLKEQFRS